MESGTTERIPGRRRRAEAWEGERRAEKPEAERS